MKYCRPISTRTVHFLLHAEKTQVPEFKEVPKGSESGIVGEKRPAEDTTKEQVVDAGGRKQNS